MPNKRVHNQNNEQTSSEDEDIKVRINIFA